ncbi:MAG: hypothetical protein K5886_07635 [Lachnospiraceae bacterium]|nr:hypothetical protein [Lachnospiraceae bacterium]
MDVTILLNLAVLIFSAKAFGLLSKRIGVGMMTRGEVALITPVVLKYLFTERQGKSENRPHDR